LPKQYKKKFISLFLPLIYRVLTMTIAVIIDQNKLKKTSLLLIVCFFLFLIGHFPDFVEKYYSAIFYPLVGKLLRISMGWLPFSLGDCLYFIIGSRLLLLCIKQFRQSSNCFLFFNFSGILNSLGKWIRLLCWVYLIFKTIWGLNYDRKGIANQLVIDRNAYSKEQIVDLTKELITQANYYRKILKDSTLQEMPVQAIVKETYKNYEALSLVYPFLRYTPSSIKETFYTPLADYVGFTGYYNPFTGEAQIRTDVPRILLPFIVSHEIAHQIGYASESEANFVGYLAASNSKNPYFQYATYLELLNYAIAEEYILYAKENNFMQFKAVMEYNNQHIDTLVQKDRKLIRDFFYKRKNNIVPISNSLFDQFLKMNKQVSGITSYNEVLGWLLAYQAKYGKL
jgi:hypothetical protein